VNRERVKKGDDAANRLQLKLLEGEQLDEERNALAVLRSLPGVDSARIAIVGHSFGGSLSLVLAAEAPPIRAVVSFGGAAASWVRSNYLRESLTSAVRKLAIPVFFVYAENDYSTEPAKVLDAEMTKQNKVHLVKIYPAFGGTRAEGHNIIYLSMGTWERDVFDFLDARVKHSPSRLLVKSQSHELTRSLKEQVRKGGLPQLMPTQPVRCFAAAEINHPSLLVLSIAVVLRQKNFYKSIFFSVTHFATPPVDPLSSLVWPERSKPATKQPASHLRRWQK
jgi:hypothetical protein